jgi:hypothetical protein
MDLARRFYGKGGSGEGFVQAGLFLGPDGRLVPAKSLPKARTARARLMAEVQAMAEFAIEGYRPGREKRVGRPLNYIVDKLAEGIAAMRAAPDSLEYQVALARVYSGMRGGAAYVSKWEKRIRAAWCEYDVDVRKLGAGTKPTDDSKFMHGLLGDALEVVGVHRPDSNGWIKGLPKNDGAHISVLGDFRVERCCWDADAETSKADLHAEYLKWLDAAKKVHPERYRESKSLKLKRFATEFNLSLATFEGQRCNEKVSIGRQHTWKGIRILPENNEPAGDKAIRWEAEFREILRQALTAPTMEK